MVQLELRYELLGPVRAWNGDTEIDLGAPQQRAILGLLLLRDGALATSDQLLTALWADKTPRAAAGMIRSYVSRLRRALSGSVIQSVAGGYVLPVAPGALDLNEFLRLIELARAARQEGRLEAWADALRAALKLWKGTPLAGVRGDFADWERERLHQHRLAAVEDLAAANLDLGRPEEAAQVLAPIVIEHPLRERPRELLMLALYRSGRQADALRLYQETQHLLADELGVDPGPELREMQRRILSSDASLAGVVHHPVVLSAPAAVVAEQLPPDLPDFTGRSEDLVRLSMLLQPTGDHLPVLGLTGAPGVGKTSLAVHLGRRLASRFPDGQYYVHMMSADDPLSALLRAAGVAALPESLSERGALWRSLTDSRRVLVVLDNAKSAREVLPLLPGPGGAAVMVTASQRLFGLPYADWVKVEPLSPEKSLELLERWSAYGGCRPSRWRLGGCWRSAPVCRRRSRPWRLGCSPGLAGASPRRTSGCGCVAVSSGGTASADRSIRRTRWRWRSCCRSRRGRSGCWRCWTTSHCARRPSYWRCLIGRPRRWWSRWSTRIWWSRVGTTGTTTCIRCGSSRGCALGRWREREPARRC
ncbi:AfsR/SARP family transcriptional regulator [Kribbella lupini]|uniref:AfsR/SARP family transcriptional regulator n=1 Tax=Kribbella lupini TaxID=291602 RepID=UPI0031D86B6D